MTHELPKELVEAIRGSCERLLRFPHRVNFKGQYENPRTCDHCPYPDCNCSNEGYVDCWNAALREMATWTKSRGSEPADSNYTLGGNDAFDDAVAHTEKLIIGEGK